MKIWLSIQYLRGYAAIVVVWLHSYLQLEKMTGLEPPTWFDGRSGVDLFFVISGFIIWITTDDEHTRPGSFWCRRIIRIVPLYWLCSFAMVFLLIAMPGLFERSHLEIWHVVESLLFVPHVDPLQPDTAYPLLPVGWTLNFEMFFYACFGVALFLCPRYRVIAMVAWLGGLVMAGAFFRPHHALLATYTDPLLLEFMAGMVIGYACNRLRRPPLVLGYILLVSAMASYVALNQGLDLIHGDWRVLCWGLPATLLVAGVVMIERQVHVFRLAALRLLGDASFAIYLSHPFALGAVGWAWSRFALDVALPNAAFIATAMMVSIMGGIFLHLAFERPIARRLCRGTSIGIGFQSGAHATLAPRSVYSRSTHLHHCPADGRFGLAQQPCNVRLDKLAPSMR